MGSGSEAVSVMKIECDVGSCDGICVGFVSRQLQQKEFSKH